MQKKMNFILVIYMVIINIQFFNVNISKPTLIDIININEN